MEVLRESHGLMFCHRKVTLDLHKEFDILDLSHVSSPLDPIVKLVSQEGDPIADTTLDRHLSVKLNYRHTH